MKTRNYVNLAGIGKHAATIMVIFAAIFFISGC